MQTRQKHEPRERVSPCHAAKYYTAGAPLCRFDEITGASKSNLALRFVGWWRHEIANRIEDDSELRVVFFLQRCELAREIGVGSKHLAQPNKRPYDLDAHFDSTRRAKHCRQHCDAMFGENVRRVAAPAVSRS